MRKTTVLSLFVLFIAISLSGCASSKRHQQDISALNAQMGVLTDELIRLDRSLADTRAAIGHEEAKLRQLESEAMVTEARIGTLKEEEGVITSLNSSEPINGVYRTPSGFELPSMSIQKALKASGYYQGKIDGKIGPATRSAVRDFQRDNGLKTDGVVGKKTWAKLKVYLTSK